MVTGILPLTEMWLTYFVCLLKVMLQIFTFIHKNYSQKTFMVPKFWLSTK